MKKFFYATIVLALTSMLFFSCSKADELVVNDEDLLVKATLIAGNPQVNPASKTEIQGGTTPFWSVGDAIGVTNGSDSNQEFTTSITSASTTATFSGETVSGDLYAYYPYSAGGVSTAGASIALSAEQNPTPVSFDGSSDVLVSKMFNITPENTTVSGLQFKRLTSVLKVVIKNNDVLPAGEHPTFVSVEAESDLIGTVLVNFASQSLSLQSGASKKVTANYTSATQFEIDGTNAAYLVVLPQTLAAGTTLKITANTENYYIEKNITVPTGGIEILEGKITTLNIGMNSSTVTHHPVINVTSDNPMAVDNIADSYTINYSIDDPLEGEIISATTDASWISNINVSISGEVTFDVAAQAYNTDARTGYITLSYKDADDVIVEIQQRKGRIEAILLLNSSYITNDQGEDTKNHNWSVSHTGKKYSVTNEYITIGGTNDKATEISLTSSGYSSNSKVWEIHVWAAAEQLNNPDVIISKGKTNKRFDVSSASFMEYKIDDDLFGEEGEITIEITRGGNEKGFMRFQKLSIVYDEETFEEWLNKL